ncbi:DRTGG domain-containing protein [Chloroflexota bacterium]
MVFLYVVSAEAAAGKTMICAGLGKHLLGAGKKVGFVKPVRVSGSDADAIFMSQALDLGESVDFICPAASSASEVHEACGRVAHEKDVVIIEGMLGEDPADNYEVARRLEARVIVVEGYTDQPARFIESYKGFEKNLLGVILNKVPVSRLEKVRDEVASHFGKAGINVLGVIPEDRLLATLTTGELAECVQGKIMSNEEKSDELVENFMLGAMVVDSGLEYFGRKANKAAVVRSDRPDMQMAALETSTRCLVISGAKESPIYNVRQKAENRGIPTIITENVTNAVIAGVEGCLGKARFKQEKKLPKLAGIIQQHLDLKEIDKGLSLAG